MFIDDTIAAIATAPGEGGIGIIRISGEKSLQVAQSIFKSKSGKMIKDYNARTLIYGTVVDNEKVSVIVTDYDEDGFWGYTVNLFLVNKTDKELTYSVDEASVNGFMADPFWATSVGAGKVAFASMSWSDSDFEDNDITTVEEIEMKFEIYDSEDWSADAIFNEVVTLNP